MNKTITLIDYGSGNLLSVSRAFEHCGVEVIQTNDPHKITSADYLVLPGVGAFEAGMNQLRESHLIEPILQYTESERPFLGICLGMQVMLDKSTEFGSHSGFGMINGVVQNIPATSSNGNSHPIPHIGWNKLSIEQIDWAGTILDKIAPDHDAVYFVHSYTALPDSNDNILASCDYNGRKIIAAICSDNLFGCQFHPEKSGLVGLNILSNFISF